MVWNDKKALKIVVIVLAAVLVVNAVAIVWLATAPSAAQPRVLPGAPQAPANASPSVSLIIVSATSQCDNKCFDASLYQPQLTQIGVNFGTTTQYELGTAEASAAISKYGLTTLPALVFSKELGSYSQIASVWTQVGTIANDGSYVLQGANPPYYDLATGSVKGLVSLTYLNDSSCSQCYDVTLHNQILSRFGMQFSNTSVVDVASAAGKALVAKYGITAVPTVLLDAEAGRYRSFGQIWQSVGTVAADGTYIFTNLTAIGQPYMDLSTGKVVVPPLANATANATP